MRTLGVILADMLGLVLAITLAVLVCFNLWAVIG
jgi:hypothetical protein